ncbi:hypothetical protein GALMADRAFT_1253955 [Galerina marginata CBS 339.88]|uniref:Uncharacterized protein n=1 Tax=Galerina marginata (strain CBS 339.88) TaxID=685588 RepID=A0A067TF63_GALM3|nr:hypothetical protein GALMADRAFT_1253955 [Galerina marginata CBS 339.88]
MINSRPCLCLLLVLLLATLGPGCGMPIRKRSSSATSKLQIQQRNMHQLHHQVHSDTSSNAASVGSGSGSSSSLASSILGAGLRLGLRVFNLGMGMGIFDMGFVGWIWPCGSGIGPEGANDLSPKSGLYVALADVFSSLSTPAQHVPVRLISLHLQPTHTYTRRMRAWSSHIIAFLRYKHTSI